MNRMANIMKRVSKQAKKQLYQSEGKTEGARKGKPGHKKQISKASIFPGIPQGETTETLEEQKQTTARNLPQGITRTQYSSYADGSDTTFPLRRRDVRVWKLLKEYTPLENGNGSKASVSDFLTLQKRIMCPN